jgi:hypothetical protein
MSRIAAIDKQYSQLRADLRKFRGTWDLVRSLRSFLAEPLSLEQAREELKRAIEHRDESFLELCRALVYGRPGSPYSRLLKSAGCDFSDLRSSVHDHGLEKTLERLAGEGVYLSAEEFKGKKDVVRGRESFRVTPADFNRKDAVGFSTQSSGTTNSPIAFSCALDWLTKKAWATSVFFSAHDLFRASHAMYDAVLPAAGAINNLLIYAKMGVVTERWFARKSPVGGWLERHYHSFINSLIVTMGRRYGPGFPKPEPIDIPEIHRIVRWVANRRSENRACSITAAVSNAARIARVAAEIGESLEGVKFNVSGEPLTEGKREVMEKVGATVTTRFSFGGSMNVGHGCGNPIHTGEIHVNLHMMALICQPNPLSNYGNVQPLLCTTVDPLASRHLLNVDHGDYATLERRNCGCALEEGGLTLHLHDIRSYEKFASEGMNYFAGDLFDFLERTLPSEFGGGPGDYQLAEEEDEGLTRITLLVHPEVGPIDEQRILSRLRQSLAAGSRNNRFMSEVWQHAGTLRLRRAVPHASGRGKVLPLHMARAAAKTPQR